MVEIVTGGSLDAPRSEPEGGSTDAAPGSIMSRIRRAAARQQKETTKDFAIGGAFGDWLMIRYKPLEPEVMDQFLLQQKDDTPAIQLNMDMMARACVAIIGHDPNTGEKEVLQDERGPVLLEHRLAVLLDLPIPTGAMLTAREVITMLFGRNGIAIGAHGDQVSEWMKNPQGEDDLGES
jgi:hypothetical protein